MSLPGCRLVKPMIFWRTESASITLLVCCRQLPLRVFTFLVLYIQLCFHHAVVYDQDKIRQRLVTIWALILPALIKEFIKFVPFLKLEHCLKFQFDDLKVLRNDITLSGPTKLVYSVCCSVSELLTVRSGLEIILSLLQSVSQPCQQCTRLTLRSTLSSARARVI